MCIEIFETHIDSLFMPLRIVIYQYDKYNWLYIHYMFYMYIHYNIIVLSTSVHEINSSLLLLLRVLQKEMEIHLLSYFLGLEK